MTRERALLGLAEAFGPGFILTWGRSVRWRWLGRERLEKAREESPGGVIYALWHGRLLPLLYAHRGGNVHILVSRHRDGELITRVARRLGNDAVRGSTTRGGREALFGLGESAERGLDLAVTPDGPRGPREVVQPGVILLAQRTGLPLVPVTAGGGRDWRLRSWDRFRIPRPFHRCWVVYGHHIIVPREPGVQGLEHHRRELEKRLREISLLADRMPSPPEALAG